MLLKQSIAAVIDGDTKALTEVLYSDSVDLRLMEKDKDRVQKVLRTLRRDYRLNTNNRDLVLSSVSAVPDARKEIVIDMLRMSYGHGYGVSYNTWSGDTPVALQYVVHGKPMLSVALRDGGRWRVTAIPFGVSAGVLKYSSLSEAIDHNAALVPPFEGK